MRIELREVTVRELAKGYSDDGEGGVVGYDGDLDIRPPYQREFIYKDRQREAVIDTVTKGFPLNVMYWAVRDDGGFEVIDGQQRTISLCQFVESEFAFNNLYFHNLPNDKQELILDYKLMIYLCSGTDSQKLEWFKTINIAGEKLTDQELRNAVYSGSWVSDAKRYFSRSSGPAYGLASDLLNGSPIRQDYLETVVEWINDGDIEAYMATHQRDPNANAIWLYFQQVIAWVRATFPSYRREMKGLPWGGLYNTFKDKALDSAKLEAEVDQLMADEDVENKRGIYTYVLTRQERHLNIRAFSANDKREAFERQAGVCVKCGETFTIEEMEADHITPWHEGGKTIADNCQLLCTFDNRSKGKK
ncbi:HNH endonuclease family protein [Microcella sp.]|uniref:HNH endonuclease family protein n=1 Tax=Microcella sp. TaxID=1913979 RepID=UPI00391B764F